MSNIASPLTYASHGNTWPESAVPELGSERQDDGSASVELRAKKILDNHPHFRGRGKWINCCCSDECLYLKGTLPTYYLKQTAQEALRELSGIKQIVNLIQVTGPGGIILQPNQTITVRRPR